MLEVKYAPKDIDDIILTERIRKTVNNLIKKKEIPNLLFYGDFGLGKTSLAKILAKKFSGEEVLYINGSLNRSIDNVRKDIMVFLETVSLHPFKTVIIDEFEMF
ncbi:MAG: AAA family ATPase [Chlorobi bacterium]|nr:AAA family ATPase [Chlorobiota bacterium]